MVNIAAAVVLTWLFDALGVKRGGDATTAADYLEDARAALGRVPPRSRGTRRPLALALRIPGHLNAKNALPAKEPA